ncbi:MAG: alpha/beta hydrolase family protein [Thermoanaerobaculia bacterium]
MTGGGSDYDPFTRGRNPVGVRTIEARDRERNRLFPCEIWYPAAARHAGEDLATATQDSFSVPTGGPPRRQKAVRDAEGKPGTYPLVVFSHHGGGPRRMATFLCTHLSSHGYVVAAMDHSEVVARELARREGETSEEKAARLEALIANRLPDVRFLLDRLLTGARFDSEIRLDDSRIGIVGHSFGGWTALAAVDVEPRIRAVVALAPGGASTRKPGIIPATLAFAWGRDVPTLYLVAEDDTSLPLEGMKEIFDRTPATRRMVILRRADHMHFLDEVEEMHEAVRKMPFSGELAWLPKEMRPLAELCSGHDAHLFVRGLTLAHLDAVLRGREDAQRFFAGDVEGELANLGVEVLAHGR